MALTTEQEEYIKKGLEDRKLHKDIAAEIGISKYKISMYINKKVRRPVLVNSEFFQVELPKDQSWIM